MKAYIVEVRKTAKGPQIVVSRTHPGLVRRLFELEVPELVDGVVEIKAVAREPGHRTKLAVASNDQNVDPVGACVGARGMRVRQVVNELRGEKVDIVPYSADPPEFVMRALAPAKVREVRHPRGHRHRRGHRPRLPAVARDRQGRPERAPRGAAHRLARRHQERDAARRGRSGRRLRRRRVGRRPRRQLMWQPAEGGEAISAAEAGYGTIGGEGAPRPPHPRPRRRRADADAEAPEPRPETAAVHDRRDRRRRGRRRARIRRRSRHRGCRTRAEEEAEIEETAGDQS